MALKTWKADVDFSNCNLLSLRHYPYPTRSLISLNRFCFRWIWLCLHLETSCLTAQKQFNQRQEYLPTSEACQWLETLICWRNATSRVAYLITLWQKITNYISFHLDSELNCSEVPEPIKIVHLFYDIWLKRLLLINCQLHYYLFLITKKNFKLKIP